MSAFTELYPALPVVSEREEATDREARAVIRYSFFWTAMLFLFSLLACLIYGEFSEILPGFLRILTTPSRLVTDYFEIGGLAAAFLNAGLCGLSCNLVMMISKAKLSPSLLAGYFLVIAHCFYGLNFVNMWPPFLGILVYCLVRKKPYREALPLSMFATSLGPFVSDFLFRYFSEDTFDPAHPRLSVAGIFVSLLFGVLAGFLIPALLPGTAKMHRGFNLYKAGLAIGLFGMFAYAFFYKTFGRSGPDVVHMTNALYEQNGHSFFLFANCFFFTVFLLTFLYGFACNGFSMKGYSALFSVDGWQDDFVMKFGIPRTLMNIGIYGASVILYLDAIILLTPGAGFTGPTVGVVIAAITFSAAGQTTKNVWPIAAGYLLLLGTVTGISALLGRPITDTVSISAQGYINGFAFATGLCPFTGRFSRKVGVAAGVLSAILCTSTVAMHGGFVLYNGGFTAGLTALLLLPILEHYHIPEREYVAGK